MLIFFDYSPKTRNNIPNTKQSPFIPIMMWKIYRFVLLLLQFRGSVSRINRHWFRLRLRPPFFLPAMHVTRKAERRKKAKGVTVFSNKRKFSFTIVKQQKNMNRVHAWWNHE